MGEKDLKAANDELKAAKEKAAKDLKDAKEKLDAEAFCAKRHCKGFVCEDVKNADKVLAKKKDQWGVGVCAKIKVHNGTAETLRYDSKGSSSGWFYSNPVDIPPGHWMCFFHVKVAGTATGAVGHVKLQGDKTISWQSSWNGSRKVEGPGNWNNTIEVDHTTANFTF